MQGGQVPGDGGQSFGGAVFQTRFQIAWSGSSGKARRGERRWACPQNSAPQPFLWICFSISAKTSRRETGRLIFTALPSCT